MHGLIFTELKRYVETKFDHATWEKLLENAGLKHQLYGTANVYPDQDIIKLVTTACTMTGLPANAILEDFGEFIAPGLVEQYAFLISPSWKLLDFLANTEETIHKVVRFNKGVTPPKLSATRVADDRLVIRYNSSRKMCALLKGIVKGAAKIYKEPVSIVESHCMLAGDPECVVTVQVGTTRVHPDLALQKSAAASR
jgi:predicted hydrocarbon binding protein